MDIMRFENPFILYALALLPVLLLLHYLQITAKKKKLEKLADSNLHELLAPAASFRRKNWKHFLLMLAFGFLILALANPQIGSRMEKAKRKGIDLVVALDVSNSMLAEDIQPSRIENARRAIDRLVTKLQGDRLGLVVFAGNAYTHLPITTDYAAARMFLSSIDTDIVPTQGTAIGEAIRKSMASFDQNTEQNKAIIIISDGENHEDDAIEIAKEAAGHGITIHTIGMGSPKGAPIPVKNSSGENTGRYKQDGSGNTVITQLNQEMMQRIAKAGKGSYITANNSRVGINKLYEELKTLEAKEFETRVYADYEDRFQYPLALAMLLLLLEHLMFNRKSSWLNKIRLFSDDTSVKKEDA